MTQIGALKNLRHLRNLRAISCFSTDYQAVAILPGALGFKTKEIRRTIPITE